MKPARFEYHDPAEVGDVLQLLDEFGDEAKPLAGGQSLVPMLALRLTRFAHLIDLNRVAELKQIKQADGFLNLGCMTRQAVVGNHADVIALAPLLARATPLIGHFQIRNRGTLGGSLAHADPASEYPAVALALDAQMIVASVAGTRLVPAADFFESTWTTCLADNELLVGVRVPTSTGRCGFAIAEVARRHGDFATVGATCALELDRYGRVERIAISLFGVGATAVRAPDLETALRGRIVSELRDDELRELGELAAHDCDPPTDIHATSFYRKKVCARLAARVVAEASEEAGRV